MRRRLGSGAGILLFVALSPMAPSAQRGAQGGLQDPLASALRHDSVYIGRTRRNTVDAAALRALVARQPVGTPLKIAIVSELPDSGRLFGTRDRYTKALHDELGLGKGILIVVTERGVSIATDGKWAAELPQFERNFAVRIRSDPVGGVKELAAQLNQQLPRYSPLGGQWPVPPGVYGNMGGFGPRRSSGPGGGGSPGPAWLPGFHMSAPASSGPWTVLLPLALVSVVGLWCGSRLAARSGALRTARGAVSRLRAEVLSGLTYADAYLDLLPDSVAATAAREARARAAALDEQASPLIHGTRSVANYGRAQALLEQAVEQTKQCRQQIDVATGGTGFAVGVDGTDYRATPAAGSATSEAAPVLTDLRAEEIPAVERAACFFCSRPARISDLTLVSIVIGSRRRKVLACADDVGIVRQGRTPQLRIIHVSGRPVPWYSAPGYDPYRDYVATRVSYTAPYGGYYGPDSGFVEGLLLGSLLSPAPEPLAYPIFIAPSGDVTGDFRAAASPDYGGNAYGPDGVSNDGSGAAGIDFSDSSTDPGVAGVDFGGAPDSNTSDFGNVDFGNGDPNSGSSDFGGDSGGSDFGGDS